MFTDIAVNGVFFMKMVNRLTFYSYVRVNYREPRHLVKYRPRRAAPRPVFD
jgi:hypothetical protein